jgi:CBS domain-containing protein
MNVAEVCTREVLLVRAEQPLVEAAREMRARHVGALVVVEERGGSVHPVGMLTDRDIVCGQFAHQADLNCLTVAEVMAAPAATVSEHQSVEQAISLLRIRGVRRAPVVNAGGELVGIVTLDDLLPAVAGELSELAQLIGSQRRRERARP